MCTIDRKDLGNISMDNYLALVRVKGVIREGSKMNGAKERKSRVTFISNEAKESLKSNAVVLQCKHDRVR
jgi:hypothetical protein